MTQIMTFIIYKIMIMLRIIELLNQGKGLVCLYMTKSGTKYVKI